MYILSCSLLHAVVRISEDFIFGRTCYISTRYCTTYVVYYTSSLRCAEKECSREASDYCFLCDKAMSPGYVTKSND